MAARIEGAGLIYLSGGNPAYLADTLRDTAVWTAIVAAHPPVRRLPGAAPARWRWPTGRPGAGKGRLERTRVGRAQALLFRPTGLRLVPNIRVIPHFDVMGSKISVDADQCTRHVVWRYDVDWYRRRHRARGWSARVAGAGPPVGVDHRYPRPAGISSRQFDHDPVGRRTRHMLRKR